VHDSKYERATEVDALIGDSKKIKDELGWFPTTNWEKLAGLMVDADCTKIAKGLGK
jgi:GDPmannose 4,6-dehydratase